MAVLLTGCGGLGGAGSEAKTFTVGPDDAGGTFVLRPDDRLVVNLAEPAAPTAIDWSIIGYPEAALDLSVDDEAAARFEFVATAAGGGRVEISGRPNCQPVAGSGGGPECPLLGAGGAAPVRLFVVTVRVETS